MLLIVVHENNGKLIDQIDQINLYTIYCYRHNSIRFDIQTSILTDYPIARYLTHSV